MPAEEAFLTYIEMIQEKELETYKWSMSIWASKTAMAESSDAEKCKPVMPEWLSGESKTYTLEEVLKMQEDKRKQELRDKKDSIN